MWKNNKKIIRTYSSSSTNNGWAIIDGVSGWKRIRPDYPSGVRNILNILSTAIANQRKVNVFLNSNNQIERVILR